MLTFPNTLANGNTADAPQVMANFAAIATYIDTTKLSAQSNLSTPYSLLPLTFSIDGDLAGGAAVNRYFKVPAGVTLIPVSAQLAFDTITAGAPTVTFQATVSASNVLTTACTKSAADAVDERIAFDITSIAAASTIVFTITNTAGGGNTANGITAVLLAKCYLTA